MLQIRIVQNSISYKKLRECVCPSLPGMELGGFKDYHAYNNVLKWESNFTLWPNAARSTKYRLYQTVLQIKVVEH